MDGKRKTCGRAAAVAAVLAGVALTWDARPAAAGEEIAVKDLPEAVVKAVSERFPNATIEEAESEVEDGQVVYEVELEGSDGTEYEVEVTADGKIIEIERDDEDEDEDGDEDDDEEDDSSTTT